MGNQAGEKLSQWNLGGWLGGLLGGTLWMFLAAIAIFLQMAAPIYGFLICLVASTVILLGWFLWQYQDSFDQRSAMLILIAALYPATMSTLAFIQLASIDNYRVDEWWYYYITGIFLFITMQFTLLKKKKPIEPAGPPETIRTFGPSDMPLTKEGVTQVDDGWCIESEEKRRVSLFEAPVSGIEQCQVTYRATLKTVDAKKRVYLEM